MSHRVDILGVGVSAINPQLALETISGWIVTGRREYVCVTGVHGVIECQRDPDLLDIHNQAGLTTPDGMPLVWMGKRAGASWIERVYGPDLMIDLCQAGIEQGWRHYFYGGAPGVPEALALALTERLPGLKVAGGWSPPFRSLTEEEVEQTSATINQAGPDIVWVGLSTPKQEHWMARFRALLDAPVLIGVGAAFDIHTGRVPQAPDWMQQRGLEWFFRLATEPRRLWRRYTYIVPRFLWLISRRPPTLLEAPPGRSRPGQVP
jgi:N-acetylglucosaminyldiphosphoundecaprenol N-acetyl-beta-D-mannosaminyltransferase